MLIKYKTEPTIIVLSPNSANLIKILTQFVYSINIRYFSPPPLPCPAALRGVFAQQNIGEVAARTKGFEVSMSPFKFLPSHKRKSNYRVTVLPSNSIAFGRNIPLAPHSCIFKIKESLIIK